MEKAHTCSPLHIHLDDVAAFFLTRNEFYDDLKRNTVCINCDLMLDCPIGSHWVWSGKVEMKIIGGVALEILKAIMRGRLHCLTLCPQVPTHAMVCRWVG